MLYCTVLKFTVQCCIALQNAPQCSAVNGTALPLRESYFEVWAAQQNIDMWPPRDKKISFLELSTRQIHLLVRRSSITQVFELLPLMCAVQSYIVRSSIHQCRVYSTVKYRWLHQCSTVQYSEVQMSTVQCSAFLGPTPGLMVAVLPWLHTWPKGKQWGSATVQCTLHCTVHCTVYSVHCTLCTVECSLLVPMAWAVAGPLQPGGSSPPSSSDTSTVTNNQLIN